MYASIRSYRLEKGDMEEAMHRVDTSFADRLAEEPGFVAYQAVDCGDNMLCTVTVFHDEAAAKRSVDLAADFVRDEMSDMELVRTDVKGGKVDVSRAASEMLQPAHA
ncbi:MAG: hypothetical protein ACJ768_12295 [Gaiellaceae bacterium]